MAKMYNKFGQLIEVGEPGQAAPTQPAQAAPATPQVAAIAPAPVLAQAQPNPADFIKALAGLFHPDALGETARANSRPGGLTPDASWESMFHTRPTGAGYFGGPSYAPTGVSNAQGAMNASQMNPYAADLSAIPAQNPHTGLGLWDINKTTAVGPGTSANFTNPPRAQPVIPTQAPAGVDLNSILSLFQRRAQTA